jgi:hypothetical protein
MATAKATPKKKPAPKTAEKKVATTKVAAPKKTTPAKKAATKKEITKKAAVKKSTKKTSDMSGFERYKMIEVAAYYMAEKNGFAGNAADFWIAAEKEIDKKLAKK